jgi:hypothetical protein
MNSRSRLSPSSRCHIFLSGRSELIIRGVQERHGLQTSNSIHVGNKSWRRNIPVDSDVVIVQYVTVHDGPTGATEHFRVRADKIQVGVFRGERVKGSLRTKIKRLTFLFHI